MSLFATARPRSPIGRISAQLAIAGCIVLLPAMILIATSLTSSSLMDLFKARKAIDAAGAHSSDFELPSPQALLAANIDEATSQVSQPKGQAATILNPHYGSKSDRNKHAEVTEAYGTEEETITSTPAAPSLSLHNQAIADQRAFCAQHSDLHSPSLPFISVDDGNILALSNNLRLKDESQDPELRLFSMYVFNSSDVVSQNLLTKGKWEFGDINAVLKELKELAEEREVPRSSIYFVDIGANVGAFTIAIAAQGFSVIAIEAMHMNAQAIRHSLCANPELIDRVTLINKGLGKDPAHCIIVSDDNNKGDGTTKCGEAADRWSHNGYSKRQDLEIVRLDDVLADWMPVLEGNVGALKIDIEGFEAMAMQGAPIFLQTVTPKYLLTEVSPGMMEDASGVSVPTYLHYMQEMGYQVRVESFHSSILTTSLVDIYEWPPVSNVWLTAEEEQDTRNMSMQP